MSSHVHNGLFTPRHQNPAPAKMPSFRLTWVERLIVGILIVMLAGLVCVSGCPVS